MSRPAPRKSNGERAGVLERFSRATARAAGSSASFALAASTIVVWAALGPLFGFSNTWQLVVNTATTIVTFLMVFLIQRSQNRDSQALHLKLNELVAALEGASNRLIDAEHLAEADLEILQRHYAHLVELARKDSSLTASHSVEEAERRWDLKKGSKRPSAKS